MNLELENKLKRNVKLDYVFCFMKNFDISSAIWVLYMVYKGLPLWQIGIAEGVFHIASFLFEVPSGAIADLFGRKNTIIAGRICSAMSAVINLFAINIWQFSIGFIISALSYNLNSGSEEAFVYDSLKEIGEEKKYLKINSRLNLIIEIAQGVATFIGGILAEYSYVYCYVAVIIVSLLAIIPAFFFKEPINLEQSKEERVTLREHFKICYKVLKGNKEILNILLYYPVVFTFFTVVYFYGQEFFSELGFNKIEISIIMLWGSLLSCVADLVCVKVMSILKNKTKYIASFLMGISIIIISFGNTIVSIIFFGIMSFANAILYPIQSESLNKLIPSKQRATIISIDSMIFSFAMICFFPISGLIADMVNLHTTFLLLGIIQIVLMIFLVNRKKQK